MRKGKRSGEKLVRQTSTFLRERNGPFSLSSLQAAKMRLVMFNPLLFLKIDSKDSSF